MTAEDEVRAAIEWYKSAPERARQERDKSLREIAEKYDLRQVDVIKMTGYSRETVRQAFATKQEEVAAPAKAPRKRTASKPAK